MMFEARLRCRHMAPNVAPALRDCLARTRLR